MTRREKVWEKREREGVKRVEKGAIPAKPAVSTEEGIRRNEESTGDFE